MKFAFDTPLADMDGNTILNEQGQGIPLGVLIVQALMAPEKKELSGMDKFLRYQLAAKVHKNIGVSNSADIDITEAALIKEVVGNVLTPLPLGRIWELLEHPLP